MTSLNPKTTVLVIDDEEAILDFMSSMLLQAGYNVIVACNGKAAMQKLESVTVDIVITDLIMPENGTRQSYYVAAPLQCVKDGACIHIYPLLHYFLSYYNNL
ncbi:MAG TPA: hypothetical protein DCO75_01270, partial [Fibrobacteres bacterium]|nr:hypothetical protein [Fibrobacterota bacterium]